MRRLLRPYKLFLRAMLKASSSTSDSVYDPYGNRYILKQMFKTQESPDPLIERLLIGEPGIRPIGQEISRNWNPGTPYLFFTFLKIGMVSLDSPKHP
jgi:hypothetical protein